MEINIEQRGNICIIKCFGNIDFDSYGVLKKTFDEIIDNNNFKIVVDLLNVNFISSTGWCVFIEVLKKIRNNGGDIRLAAMTENVKNIYEKVNF